MQISTITYSESIETVNDSFNKKWFKSKIEISDVGNDLSKARELAMDYVGETLKIALANNPDYVPNPNEPISRKLTGTDSNNANVDIEFENLKIKLMEFKTLAEAEQYLSTTDFRHAITAKQFINSNFK